MDNKRLYKFYCTIKSNEYSYWFDYLDNKNWLFHDWFSDWYRIRNIDTGGIAVVKVL